MNVEEEYLFQDYINIFVQFLGQDDLGLGVHVMNNVMQLMNVMDVM